MKITEIFEILQSLYQQGYITLDEDGDLQETELGRVSEDFRKYLKELEEDYWDLIVPAKLEAAEELFKEYYYSLPLNQALKEN